MSSFQRCPDRGYLFKSVLVKSERCPDRGYLFGGVLIKGYFLSLMCRLESYLQECVLVRNSCHTHLVLMTSSLKSLPITMTTAKSRKKLTKTLKINQILPLTKPHPLMKTRPLMKPHPLTKEHPQNKNVKRESQEGSSKSLIMLQGVAKNR